jgi:hypothetical protein
LQWHLWVAVFTKLQPKMEREAGKTFIKKNK